MIINRTTLFIIFLSLLSISSSHGILSKKRKTETLEKEKEYFTFTCPPAEQVEEARKMTLRRTNFAYSPQPDYIVNKGEDVYFLTGGDAEPPYVFKRIVIGYDIFCLYGS